MPLGWSHAGPIARALTLAYPDADRLAVGHDALEKMVRALPGFDIAPAPTSQQLDSILWRWAQYAHGEEAA